METFKEDLLKAIKYGIGEDWTWDDDDLEEYPVMTFNENESLEAVLEVLDKYGIDYDQKALILGPDDSPEKEYTIRIADVQFSGKRCEIDSNEHLPSYVFKCYLEPGEQ